MEESFAELLVQVRTKMKTIRFKSEMIPLLEKFVDAQYMEGHDAYDLEANIGLMKLYQFNRSRCEVERVEKMLTLALMRFPENDFFLFTTMMDEKLLDSPEISSLRKLSELLETGRYIQFWDLTTKDDNLMSVPGFATRLQKSILNNVLSTFVRIPVKTLASFLGTSEDEVAQLIKDQRDWKVDEERCIVFPQAKTKAVSEGPVRKQRALKFEHLEPLLSFKK